MVIGRLPLLMKMNIVQPLHCVNGKSAAIAFFLRSHYNAAMTPDTPFRKWRTQLGLTLEQAAAALRVSRSQIANWDAGVDRASKRSAAPPYAVRCLMTVIANGETPKSWPE
jgi:DNA-binding transcriptional regulator YiaG